MLAVGAGGGCLDIFSLICHFSFLSPSLWETARYRLNYCLKGPLSPKQPTNQFQSYQDDGGVGDNERLWANAPNAPHCGAAPLVVLVVQMVYMGNTGWYASLFIAYSLRLSAAQSIKK